MQSISAAEVLVYHAAPASVGAMKVLLAAWLTTLSLWADPYRAVFRADLDDAELGPLNRPQIASVVRAVDRAGPKAIVLKFFIVEARDPKGDAELIEAVRACRAPVILQADLDDGEKRPNAYPERFHRSDLPSIETAFNGKNGSLPLPALAAVGCEIGFIDGLSPLPIVERYRGRMVPSLYLVVLEQAFGRARVTKDAVRFGGARLSLSGGCVELPDPRLESFTSFSYSAALAGKADGPLKDAIAIIGVDDKSMHSFPTSNGPVKAHRLFVHLLQAAHAEIERQQKAAGK